MPIVAKNEGGAFQNAPEGTSVAVCCDVVDLGIITSVWEGETRSAHKIDVVFQLAELMDDGRPFTIRQRFTLSLNEKANLRKFLESWRGRAFTAAELKDGFDVEKLIGAPALIQTVHVTRGEKTYANINSVMTLPKSMKAITVRDYVRVKDREPQPEQPVAAGVGAGDDTADALPF